MHTRIAMLKVLVNSGNIQIRKAAVIRVIEMSNDNSFIFN